jgi:hypothetical protein
MQTAGTAKRKHGRKAIEPHFFGEKNARHSAAAELFLDAVAGAKCCLHARLEIGHAIVPVRVLRSYESPRS